MDVYQRADRSPVEHPFSIRGAHVDTAVAHRMTKVIMPVCAMDSISFIEIHRVWYIG